MIEGNKERNDNDEKASSDLGKKQRSAGSDVPTDPSKRLHRILKASENDDEPLSSISETSPYSPPVQPEQTFGWYSGLPVEDSGKQEIINRHPTGEPEQTGGWYGQSEAKDQSVLPSDSTRVNSSIPSGSTQPVKPVRSSQPEDATMPPDETTPTLMDLPRQVEEVDPYATQVSPVAYETRPSHRRDLSSEPGYTRRPSARRIVTSPPRNSVRPGSTGAGNDENGAQKFWVSSLGCALRVFLAFIFVAIFIFIGAVSFAVYRYFSIAATLPDVGDLKARASQFETTRILDRNGGVLYEILDPNAGRRTYVPLNRISPFVVAATIATEDKDFYNHAGFDPVAIVRALWQNYTTGETVSGASTITQQLARALLLSPSERYERTVERKSREIVLAAEITRRFTKDEILELYINENYYGSMSYGIEAAAETYFNTKAEKLNLAQATFLVGLPQAPGVYDIYTNRDETLNRQKQVVILTYEMSKERNCIEVSNSTQPVCVDAVAATEAAREIENYNFERKQGSLKYPHWVNYIRSVLESQYDSQTIYRSGFTVYTTLDPALQDLAQQTVSEQVASLADRNATDGALVAIRPSTGEILAMVGSADFYNEAISGQVNMAVAPRQPGSSFKPLTYSAAFEKGWTPSTLIWDVPSEFPPSGKPDDPAPKYVPVNYDGRFHGPVTVREALANSFNVPAVKTLDFIGVYDNPDTISPDGIINFAKRLGITTLMREDYGLALTLGGGDVTLLELTGAYAVFANGGRRMPPVAITRIEDYQGTLVYEYTFPSGDQVMRPEHAFLISSILSDNAARTPMFGANSVLNLPFTVAAKTGTTNDFRDNWTLGYTPDLAVGTWVGNADYTPMINTTGLSGAAPIWAQYMQPAIQMVTGGSPSNFSRPAGIVDKVICSSSGTEPSEWCPSQRSEIFAADQLPLEKENDLWQKIQIDTWTGLRSSSFCPDFTKEEFALNTKDPWAIKWIRETEQGRDWARSVGFNDDPIFFAPERECQEKDSKANIQFVGISENQTISTTPIDIYAIVNSSSNFKDFRVEYGKGDDPSNWKTLVEGINQQFSLPERIYSWDLKDIAAGTVTLRIYLSSTEGTYAEKQIHLNIQVPTPIPTITPTPTETMTPSPTMMPTMTETPVPTVIPSNTVSPTDELLPMP